MLHVPTVFGLITRKTNQIAAFVLAILLGVSPLMAGISITPSNGIVITDATGGLAQLTISSTDTEDVPDGEHGIPYEFTLVDATLPYEIVTGNLHIAQNVGIP